MTFVVVVSDEEIGLRAWIYKMSFAVVGGWWRVKLFWRILGDIREN